ncbi:MAG: 3-oxoacyl-ACP synthase III family protein [Myxococcales bacterium]
MKASGIGIVGVGVHLPPDVRRNDHWSDETVAGFSRRGQDDIAAPSQKALETLASSPSAKITFEEMAKWKGDPFHGAVERRVAAEGVLSSDMELEAAKSALAAAGLKADDIGLLLLQSVVPDWALSTNPAILHHRLGLPTTCPGINTDNTCGGFLFQLQLASSVLMAGGARYALLVQSALMSRILDYSHPGSTTFGDAATAVVLGPVGPKRGILSIQNFMDGRYNGIAVFASPDNSPWYRGRGPLTLKTIDHARMSEVPLITGDLAAQAVGGTLDEAGLDRQEVDLFLSHQPTISFNAICRRAAGLEQVKTVNTFAHLGSTSSCVVPMNLEIALKERMVGDDDVAIFFTTGAGLNWGAAAVRLGR